MPDSPKKRFRALESAISAYGRINGVPFERVRKRLAHMLICGVLTEAQRIGLIPAYFVKGGVALELRLGTLARLTKDIDIGIVAPPSKLLPTLKAALGAGYGDFTFDIVDDHVLPNGTLRAEVQITYCGLGWAKMDVDLSPATTDVATELVPAMHLEDFGLGNFDIVCISIEEQLAQKLHGGTEPDRIDYTNLRSRDVFDSLVMARQLQIDYLALKSAAETIFASRAIHPWPPSSEIRNSWHDDLRRIADENGYHTTGIPTMQREFTNIFVAALGVPPMPGFEYQFLAIAIHTPVSGEQFASPVETRDVSFQNLQEHARRGWRIVSTLRHPLRPDELLIAVMERALDEG